jgi:signal transduction histidine kinase
VYNIIVKQKRYFLSWLIAFISLPLLAILAINQFNWLQELQKRERERVQAGMIHSAELLSKRLQEELLFLPSLMRFRNEEGAEFDRLFTERFLFWQYYSINASYVKEINLQDVATGKDYSWAKDRFIPSERVNRPEKPKGSANPGEATENRASKAPPKRQFIQDEDDIRVSLPINLGKDRPASIEFVFDKQVLLSNVIPKIAEESLSSTDVYAYRIVDAHEGKVYFSSLPNVESSVFSDPDVELPLIADFSMPTFKESQFLTTRIIPEGTEKTLSFIKERTQIERIAPPDEGMQSIFQGMKIQIANRDGSLATLSKRATAQNATISFGIVIVLSFLILTLAEASRRSRSLAKSQQEFIATITHELKTPLAVIGSAAQNLTDGLVKDQQKAEQYGQIIWKEASRLGVSIEHFLLYSNAGSLTRTKPTLCDVSELVEAALKFTDEARTTGEYRTEIALPERPAFILGDRIALESVFQNLAQNVISHASEGKYLGIIVSLEKGKKKKYSGNRVIVKFRDKGPGIPTREQRRIFDPFERGVRAMEMQIPGNGIGLNLVKRIVTMHNGTVAVESKLGVGSTFIVDLPEECGVFEPISRGDTDTPQGGDNAE